MEDAVQMITELCNHPFRGGSCYWAQAAYRRRSTKKATSEATRLPEGRVPSSAALTASSKDSPISFASTVISSLSCSSVIGCPCSIALTRFAGRLPHRSVLRFGSVFQERAYVNG